MATADFNALRASIISHFNELASIQESLDAVLSIDGYSQSKVIVEYLNIRFGIVLNDLDTDLFNAGLYGELLNGR